MYCGWQTRGAKIRWGAVAFLLVAFTALGIMYGVTSRDCVVCQSEGNVVDENGETFARLHSCRDINGVSRLTEVENCNKAFVVGSFMGFVLSAILLLVPCCAMCCATSPATMMAQQRVAASRAAQAQAVQPPPPAKPAANKPAVPAAPPPAEKPRLGRSASKPSKPKKGADPLSQPAF